MQAEQLLKDLIQRFQDNESEKKIAYISSRIKSPDSMIKKLEKKKIEPTAENALLKVNDAVGVRVICSFVDDIYKVSKWLDDQEEIEIIKIKDYIAYPKENRYRSYHMILKIKVVLEYK